MKLIVLRCPTCGAHVDVKEGSKRAVCEYCDTPFYVDDELQSQNDAGAGEVHPQEKSKAQKEERPAGDADPEYADLAFELSKRDNADRAEQNRRKRRQKAVLVFALALVAALLIRNQALIWIIVIVGVIIVLSGRSKSRQPRGRAHYYNEEESYSNKNQLVALLLCIFLGVFGAHYFYVGKVGKGLLFFFTIGVFGIGWLIDIIRIACGLFRDRDDCYLRGWG